MMENQHDSIQITISKFRDGDIDAFENIFYQLHPRLCSFSSRYTKNAASSEEIVSDSFIILWNNRQKFKDFSSLKSYLYITVRNASLDFLKKNREGIAIEDVYSDSTKNIEFLMIEEETHSLLYQALETLPNKCKEVFVQSCLNGLKYEDIAEEMQITLNTVKSQRARAIQLLKERLTVNPYIN